VRFFAGCADAGELDMLIEELRDLQNDKILKYTNYPRTVTSQLLSDYVFTQKPKKLTEVVKILVDGINIGNIINQSSRSNDPLLLPNECGRKEVVLECFNQLILFPKKDYSEELISILKNNPSENLTRWSELSKLFNGSKLTIWLEYGYKIGIIHKISEDHLVKILKEGDKFETIKRLQIIIHGNRVEIINKNLEFKQLIYDNLFNIEITSVIINQKASSLNFLSMILHPYLLSRILNLDESNETFINHYLRYLNRPKVDKSSDLISEFEVLDNIDRKIDNFKNSISSLFDVPLKEFKVNIDLWDFLVECIKQEAGVSRIAYTTAVISAGIKSTDKIPEIYKDLNNDSLSLCKRVRYARLKSGNIRYWEIQFANNSQISFTLLVFFNWATAKTVILLLPIIAIIIKNLSQEEFNILIDDMSNIPNSPKFTKRQQLDIEKILEAEDISDEIKYILSHRYQDEKKFIYNYIKKETGVFQKTVEVKFEFLVKKFLTKTNDEKLLNQIKEMYKNIYSYNERYYYYSYDNNEVNRIPLELSKKIMSNCKDYPKIISSLAEKTCRQYANEHQDAIGQIAIEGKWFENN